MDARPVAAFGDGEGTSRPLIRKERMSRAPEPPTPPPPAMPANGPGQIPAPLAGCDRSSAGSQSPHRAPLLPPALPPPLSLPQTGPPRLRPAASSTRKIAERIPRARGKTPPHSARSAPVRKPPPATSPTPFGSVVVVSSHKIAISRNHKQDAVHVALTFLLPVLGAQVPQI